MNTFNVISRCLLLIISISFSLISCKKNHSIVDRGEGPVRQVIFNFEDFKKEIKPFNSPIITKSTSTSGAVAENPERLELLMFGDFNGPGIFPNYLREGIKFRWGTYFLPLIKKVNRPLSLNAFGDSVLTFKGSNLGFFFFLDTTSIEKLGRIEFDVSTNKIGKDTIYFVLGENKPNSKYKGRDHFELIVNSDDVPKNGLRTFSLDIQGRNDILRSNLVKGEFQFTLYRDNFEYFYFLDNFRFYGRTNNSINPNKPKNFNLNYFIFNQENGNLVNSGHFIPNSSTNNLLLDLPEGKYYSTLVYSELNEPLSYPREVKHIRDFYIGTSFKDKFARTFAVLDSFELKESIEKKVNFQRAYSMVTLDFTDLKDLSEIKKIIVKPMMAPIRWSPFNPNLEIIIPKSEDNVIEFVQNFHIHKEISFNQFIGMRSDEMPLHYEFEVWDDTKMVRKFRLNAAVKNNVKLIFKGDLYPSGMVNKIFEIIIDEEWDDTKIVEFK